MAARRLTDRIKERLDREVGTIYKPHADRLKFALAFPNTYYIGMSNLGFQTVYRLINDDDRAVCERVFLPDPPDLEDITKSGNLLITMESQMPVRSFDVLAFSLSYELDYPNVLKILSLSGLPLLSADRSPEMPLVIAGGPAATFNPEPLAPFIDVFILGEAEEVVPELISALWDNADDRNDLLLKLANIEGVYIPRFYEPEYNEDGTIRCVKASPDVPEKIHRRWVRNIDLYPATTTILTPETEFSNMVLAEVARGCGRQCRFCIAGYAYLPPRARTPGAVLDGIRRAEEKATERTIENPRIGLLSASVFDHPGSLLICESLVEQNRLFSISSTRADTLNQDVAQALHRGGHETLTIAPEAGTDRLRRVINKAFTDREVLNAAAVARDAGFRRLKLYFMVGLPTETEEDIEGIHTLTSRIAGMFAWEKIIVSVSCFVPKPWTPFQWAPMEEESSLAAKLMSIKNSLRPVKRVEVMGESAREAVVQGVLARGDRRLRDALIAQHEENVSWRAAFRQGSVDPRFYAQRARGKEEIFPWDHLDLGVKKEYLWREYENSMKEQSTTACLVGRCRRCGVCYYS